jgi:signal transduction histidine kinase/CheY-like chemotaxis protein
MGSGGESRGHSPGHRRAVLEGICVAVGFMLVGAIASFGLWRSSVASLRAQLDDELVRLASIGAGLIDPELHASFRDPSQLDSDPYMKAIEPLRRFRDHAPGVKYVYTAIRKGDAVHFILDAAEPGDNDGDGREDRAGIDEEYDDCEDAIHIAFGSESSPGRAVSSPEPYTDEWGTFITGYAPIHDAEGRVIAVIGVDVTADRFIERLALAKAQTLWGLVPAVGVSAIIGALAFTMRRRTLALQAAEARVSEALRDSVEELAVRNDELIRMRVRAEEAAATKASFLANMSHEIRTPLTAVLGYVDLIEESLGGDGDDRSAASDQRRSHLRTIRAAGEHLLTIINDILDLSKIEAGRMELESLPVDLPALLVDVEGIMRPRADERSVALRCVLLTPIPSRIVSDPTRVRQVLINLVSNAIKFTERGEVRVEVRSVDGELSVEVIDSGVGMSDEQSAALFRPFTQADASVTRRHGGTGLGLSICRRLGEMLGGAVELVRTAPGEGSTFRFRIPIREAPDSVSVTDLVHASRSTDPSATGDGLRMATLRGRILLAEDGKDNQRLIAHHLRKAGAQVEIAENGVEALRLLDEASRAGAPFDLLLTDVQMPEMDGCTLARSIRGRDRNFPIVALTAHAMAEDRERCREAGCDDYATKPIDRQRLIAVCARWLGGRAA